VASGLEQLLLPAECLVCRQLLSTRLSARRVCDVCRHRWRAVRPPWCDRCGQPGPHFGLCRVCHDWPPALRRARSAVWLDAGARDAVHAIKYGGWAGLAVELADVMRANLAAPAADALLVPVPLARRRQRQRGYNQSERIAAALGVGWRRPVLTDLLVRVRAGRTQTALTPEARQANVAGAFAARPHTRAGAPLVLVDDVFTTGATLAECARTLAGAGWHAVTAVTFGRAVIPDFT